MPKLVFDPKEHEYWLGRDRLESVTEVIEGLGIIDATWFTETSRIRGARVHSATALFDQGRLDWESLAPIEAVLGEPIANYVRAWEAFRNETGFTPAKIEIIGYHDRYRYAGTLDRIGTFANGREALLDIKTGPVEDWVGLQTAAYNAMHPSQRPRARCGVGLRADGTYMIREFPDVDDEPTFLYALAVLRWGRRHGSYQRN